MLMSVPSLSSFSFRYLVLVLVDAAREFLLSLNKTRNEGRQPAIIAIWSSQIVQIDTSVILKFWGFHFVVLSTLMYRIRENDRLAEPRRKTMAMANRSEVLLI